MDKPGISRSSPLGALPLAWLSRPPSAGSLAHLCSFHSQLSLDLGAVLLTAHFPAAQRGPLSQVLPDVEYLENIPIGRDLSSECPETRKESRTRTQEGQSQTPELGLRGTWGDRVVPVARVPPSSPICPCASLCWLFFAAVHSALD